MRKNDLIKLLQEIDGNPEVSLWNGFVGDWMPISKEIEVIELVKESKEFVRTAIDHEAARDGATPMSDEEFEKWFKKSSYNEWDMPNQFVKPADFERWYGKRRKKLIVLQATARGKSTFDRSGSIDY
jgi:hypothetical protein